MRKVVSNTTPLIALAYKLYDEIMIKSDGIMLALRAVICVLMLSNLKKLIDNI